MPRRTPPATGDGSDITATSQRQAEAMSRNDAAAVAGFYASDAWLFAPNEELIKGQAGILKWWQNALSGPPATAKLMSEEVQSCGETAWETGRYSITATDGKVLDKGKYVTIWKRDGSTWKLYRDIFNTDVPAPR